MNNYNQQFYQDVLTGADNQAEQSRFPAPAVDRKQIQKGHFVMNLKELYACCGGDFDTVMDIWRSDERVARFLGRFLEDGSYANFHKFLDAGNLPEAFRAVHTLKGVCLNLCLTRLSESSATVTDALRGGADHTTPPCWPALMRTMPR